jgi:hypothetical protein
MKQMSSELLRTHCASTRRGFIAGAVSAFAINIRIAGNGFL